jgi:hypothetical protein
MKDAIKIFDLSKKILLADREFVAAMELGKTG